MNTKIKQISFMSGGSAYWPVLSKKASTTINFYTWIGEEGVS